MTEASGRVDKVERAGALAARVRGAIGAVIVGQSTVIDEVLLCLLAGGHALLEGVPGLGKTLLVRALSGAMSLKFSRIQFTPDLMPADVTGTRIATEDARGARRFEFVSGPVFGQLVLADEINRATPKTQSALLEAMQEHQVTLSGERHVLEEPFMVLATQNPIEMEGTYPLPEAQLDRFLLKIMVERPNPEVMAVILAKTTGGEVVMPTSVATAQDVLEARGVCREVVVATPLLQWVSRLLAALDPDDKSAHPKARSGLRVGPGVRGGQSMVLAAKATALMAGRAQVSIKDLDRVALPALRHRLILSFEGETSGLKPDGLVTEVLAETRPTG